ncbi:unnamed protein product, partial [Candidula unifasciata]
MELPDATVDSTDVDNDQQLLEPSVVSQEDKILSEQIVSIRIAQTDSQAAPKQPAQAATKKVPPKAAQKQGKPPAYSDLSRKTSEARQKLLSTQKSQLHLEVSRGQTLKGNKDELRKQQPRPDQQQQKRTVQQNTQRLPKQRKKKRRSCCGGSPDRNVDNDARHIEAIIASQQSSSKCCCAPLCCCCCRQTDQSDSQAKKGGACSKCCKKFLAFLFSHVGLCSMVVAYAIMGGFLFQWLEAADEIEERIMISRKRNSSISK